MNLAPNGKPSNLTTEQYRLVRTPEFKAWFGDWEKSPETASKVVDENGEPLVVFHGTNKKFNIFKESKYKDWYFFTADIEEAKNYAENVGGSVIMQVFLNCRNPNPNKTNLQNSINKNLLPKEYDSHFQGSWDISDFRIVVVKSPTQIKLADGTNTTFDTNNPDIRYEIGGIFGSPYEVEVQHLLNSKETKKIMSSLGSKKDINYWVEKYHSKTKNHKKNTYYRVERGSGKGYGGFGKGLYLGRDKYALSNFYDIEQEGLPITEYYGSPKWLDLTSYKKEKSFINILKRNGIDIINSKEVSSIVTEMGYDGIRYYDPLATGEEFVLFNTDKLIKVDKISYSVGGEITLTTEQVENKLSRKLHWWNDYVVSINGIEYKKVFLRNEYKRL